MWEWRKKSVLERGVGGERRMESGRCGVNRKSQNTNVLLVHSELGKSKRVTFELPSSKVRQICHLCPAQD